MLPQLSGTFANKNKRSVDVDACSPFESRFVGPISLQRCEMSNYIEETTTLHRNQTRDLSGIVNLLASCFLL